MFNYRPIADDDYWEDNSVSNLLAYASIKLVPKWCATPTHWTVKVMDYFWTECACCLFFRGVVLGACVTSAVGVMLALTVATLF